MLGLSIGTDSGAPKLGRSNHKSYNFSSSNIGRFYTSGVSGSMKKHTAKKVKDQQAVEKDGIDDQDEKLRKLKERSKNYVPERLEVRQREIEEDTMKLLALEKKLDEVKRQKDLKRRREEARKVQRLQFSSARAIQRLARRWLLKRWMRAATTLQVFLKFAAARQAVAAATWAISTLRGFVQMIEIKYIRYNQLKHAAHSAAVSTWLSVQQSSAIGVSEARKQAILLAAHSIQVGARAVALQKQHKKRPLKKKLVSPKAFGSPNRATKLWALLRKRVVPVHFKFHDTAWRRRTYFTDGYLNPAKDMEHPHFQKKGKISVTDVAMQVEERKKRTKLEEVMRLHKQREEKMAHERILRLQMIEEEKKKRELDVSEREQKELMRKAKKEKSKIDFLRRVENEQSERAKLVNQARERKEKIRKEQEAQLKLEADNEAHENKMMYAEDTRFFQNLEKVRKQRLKEYATKRKMELEKVEKDLLPGPNQAGVISARAKGNSALGGQEGMTQHELALEEERKMHVWAANDAALKQRLAARRAAEKEEKLNAEMEIEMIRKEKELVAMKAQLMLKRAAFMKAKAKKLKEQAQENTASQQQEVPSSHGSTSARARSRGGSRGGNRKKTNRAGSGSAPTTARESPSKRQNANTIYDIDDPLVLDSLLPHRKIDPPGEDWDWHTPRAVGSGKSAISDLRKSKYSPILHKHVAAKDSGPLISPNAIRLNSAERLAMACLTEQQRPPHPFDQLNNEDIVQDSPFKSTSDRELLSPSRRQLPLSPIEQLQNEELKESLKLPLIAHTSSEGNLNNKEKNIVSKGVLKNKYINAKLFNSPYGSLVPQQNIPSKQKQNQNLKQKQSTKNQNIEVEPVSLKSDPYLLPQTVVAPTSTSISMNRPLLPSSMQGVNILSDKNKRTAKGGSLMEIVEKAREKLNLDKNVNDSKNDTTAALVAATSALGQLDERKTGDEDHDKHLSDEEGESTRSTNKPKVKKKVKKARKKTAVPSTSVPEKIIPPVVANKEKVSKRKLINETYTKIMKAEREKKAAEKMATEKASACDEVPPEVVTNFFAMRRQDKEDTYTETTDNLQDGEKSTSLTYWSSVVGGNGSLEDGDGPALGVSPKQSLKENRSIKQAKEENNRDGSVLDIFKIEEDVCSDEVADNKQHELDDDNEEKLYQAALKKLQQHPSQSEDYNEEENDEYDEYFEVDFNHNMEANDFEVDAEFRESDSYGDAYEDELNMECERLRAELEKKILAKFTS